MRQNIDLFTQRYIQITLVFMIFVAIAQFSHIPYRAWIILTGGAIYAGFNPGNVLKRAYMRLTGTIAGVCLVIMTWYLLEIDFRLEIIFIVFAIWAVVFFIQLPYSRFMIAMTLFSDLSIQLMSHGQFYLQDYVTNRLLATVIAFSICLIVEYFWFSKRQFTALNYTYHIDMAYRDLSDLFALINHHEANRAAVYRKMESISLTIIILNELIDGDQYNTKKERNLYNYDNIVHDTLQNLRNIVSLFYISGQEPQNPNIPLLKNTIKEALTAYSKNIRSTT